VRDEYIAAQIATGKQYTVVFLKTGGVPKPEGEARAALQRAHQRHLFALKQEGLATLFGPFTDGGDLRGMVFFNTADQDLVRRRIAEDPYVRAGVMTFELHAWFGLPGDGIR
jgi:uncharacterized protein YciI